MQMILKLLPVPKEWKKVLKNMKNYNAKEVEVNYISN